MKGRSYTASYTAITVACVPTYIAIGREKRAHDGLREWLLQLRVLQCLQLMFKGSNKQKHTFPSDIMLPAQLAKTSFLTLTQFWPFLTWSLPCFSLTWSPPWNWSVFPWSWSSSSSSEHCRSSSLLPPSHGAAVKRTSDTRATSKQLHAKVLSI